MAAFAASIQTLKAVKFADVCIFVRPELTLSSTVPTNEINRNSGHI